jgi:hypothetical protein
MHNANDNAHDPGIGCDASTDSLPLKKSVSSCEMVTPTAKDTNRFLWRVESRSIRARGRGKSPHTKGTTFDVRGGIYPPPADGRFMGAGHGYVGGA